jgi:hypothetical protein
LNCRSLCCSYALLCVSKAEKPTPKNCN